VAAAWKSAGASALLDAILYDDPSPFPDYGPGDPDPDLTSATVVVLGSPDPSRSPAGASD